MILVIDSTGRQFHAAQLKLHGPLRHLGNNVWQSSLQGMGVTTHLVRTVTAFRTRTVTRWHPKTVPINTLTHSGRFGTVWQTRIVTRNIDKPVTHLVSRVSDRLVIVTRNLPARTFTQAAYRTRWVLRSVTRLNEITSLISRPVTREMTRRVSRVSSIWFTREFTRERSTTRINPGATSTKGVTRRVTNVHSVTGSIGSVTRRTTREVTQIRSVTVHRTRCLTREVTRARTVSKLAGILCNSCSPPLPYRMSVSISGFGGDFEIFNGTKTITWREGCQWWWQSGDAYAVLYWTGSSWAWYLNPTGDPNCYMQPCMLNARCSFIYNGDPCDPREVYFDSCGLYNRCTGCSDITSCNLSSGCQLVVSY